MVTRYFPPSGGCPTRQRQRPDAYAAMADRNKPLWAYFESAIDSLDMVPRGVISPSEKGAKDMIHSYYGIINNMGIKAQNTVHSSSARAWYLRTMSLLFVLELRIRFSNVYYGGTFTPEHEFTVYYTAADILRRETKTPVVPSDEWSFCEHARAFFRMLREQGFERKFRSFGRCGCMIPAIPDRLLELSA